MVFCALAAGTALWQTHFLQHNPIPAEGGRYGVAFKRPCITVELKFARDASDEELSELAREALAQIAERSYDADALPGCASGRLRYGVAFSGKRAAVAVERVA